uniref:Uncharacterized protein n=1 Tax=Romanomermis culicivorax TaxID=13658 RepID=A0A915KTN1_ROMCU
MKIKNNDNLFCVSALAVAHAYVDKDPHLNTIRKPGNTPNTMQKRLVDQLMAVAGLGNLVTRCGYTELEKMQTALLPHYQIKVWCKEDSNDLFYEGQPADKILNLYLHDRHYDVISNSGSGDPPRAEPFTDHMALYQWKQGNHYKKSYQYSPQSYLHCLTSQNVHALDILTINIRLPALLTSPCSLEEYKDVNETIHNAICVMTDDPRKLFIFQCWNDLNGNPEDILKKFKAILPNVEPKFRHESITHISNNWDVTIASDQPNATGHFELTGQLGQRRALDPAQSMDDCVGVKIVHPSLDSHILVPFCHRQNMNVDRILSIFKHVQQSKQAFELDQGMQWKVVIIENPEGAGYKQVVESTSTLVNWKQWFSYHCGNSGCFIQGSKQTDKTVCVTYIFWVKNK